MKWLIIAVIIFAQQPAKAPESKGAAKPKVAINTGQTEKTDQGSSPSQPSVSVTVNNPPASPNGDSNKEQAEENMRIQRRLAFYTGLLVCAGFITAGLIWWQAKKTAEATKAMQGSILHQQHAAEAALLGAQATINAQRAWIVVEFEHWKVEGLQGLLFQAINRGQTPADIVEAYFDHEFFPAIPDNLPLPPRYKNPVRIPPRGDNMLVTGEKWPLNQAPIHLEALIENSMKTEAIATTREILCLFGQIKYRDVLRGKDDKAGLHHTRFCFVYVPVFGYLLPSGPSEYREKS